MLITHYGDEPKFNTWLINSSLVKNQILLFNQSI